MRNYQILSHVKWDCKYHIIFVTKYRHKTIYGNIRKGIEPIVRQLCDQKGLELHEGHAMSDHIHLCLSISPKFSVSNTVFESYQRVKAQYEYIESCFIPNG